MTSPDDPAASAPKSHAPRHGLLVIGLILIAMALFAVYANVQRARRDQIETVTIAPAPPPKASPIVAPPDAP